MSTDTFTVSTDAEALAAIAAVERKAALAEVSALVKVLQGKDAKAKRTARIALARDYLAVLDGESCIRASFTVRGENGMTMPYISFCGVECRFYTNGTFKAASVY